ncbi:unnamed protein product [Mytilus coruscus]|uniref:Uncharacterized protein n=1 Tax=Mytilus coruscus TaxID=42192 RepID=A0A6J8EC96_MYTCO|nr:unnamed protein product [Mytilus coruscus]
MHQSHFFSSFLRCYMQVTCTATTTRYGQNAPLSPPPRPYFRSSTVSAGDRISLSTLKRKIQVLDPVQDVVKSVHKSCVRKPGPKPWKLDDFNWNVVKRTIYDMYRKKEVVSMPRLHEVLKEKDINASLSTVVRTVKSLGFRFSKKGSGRRHVVERDEIVALRHHYLRQVRKYRQQERHIVYLDETWLNSNHVVKGD